METKNKADCLCPKFQKAFQMLGKKWNGEIIETFLVGGPMRFKDITKNVKDCSDRVLTERLNELQERGIVEKVPCDTCSASNYQLTEQGKELAPIMDAVHTWSDKWCKD